VIDVLKCHRQLEATDTIVRCGYVTHVTGLVIESQGPETSIGDLCYIQKHGPSADALSGGAIEAEVVGFKANKVILMPLGSMAGIGPGAEVHNTGRPMQVHVGEAVIGRVIDGLGAPIDGRGPLSAKDTRSVYASPPHALERERLNEVLETGVKAIDGLLTCAKGQRLGLFSGSGVGKSVLLGMIARASQADVNVIALVGERGREVREFIERDLGEEGLKRSVVVVVTSDQPSLLRLKAAYTASTTAEFFRDQGKDVILMMDSVTRFAMAQREVGLAIGEPPATKGYTPSVFALLPQLLERAGKSRRGSITGLYTVLVESDDMNEPISDAVRSILDGHIVLSRELAMANHYPAIDILQSISRSMVDIISPEHQEWARQIREILSTHNRVRDLINIGAYVRGNNPKVDAAVDAIDQINAYLRQEMKESVPFEDSVRRLKDLALPAQPSVGAVPENAWRSNL